MTWLLLEGTSVDPFSPLLSVGTIGVVFVLVLLGWLWPKPGVEAKDRVIEAKDKEIDAWKRAYEIERDAHILLQQDRSAQLEHNRFIEKLFEEFRDMAKASQ